jgi:polar amino acid transport system permease protein
VTAALEGRKGLTRKQRTTLIRTGQYFLILIIVVILALVGDWAAFKTSFLNFHTMGELLPSVIKTGLVNTLIYALSAFVVGLLVGLLVALMRLSQVALYRWLGTIYVEIFRGLPALLVLFLVSLGIPLVFPKSGLLANYYVDVAIGLGSVAAAYISETIRAGIQAVPKGQMEAARTLGMSQGHAMRTIVLPQAFRIIIPPMTNEIILLVKDSSLVYALGLTVKQYEITKLTTNASTGGVIGIPAGATPLLMGGLAYLVITLPLSQAVRRLEIKQAKRR